LLDFKKLEEMATDLVNQDRFNLISGNTDSGNGQKD
jgi:hypothetical protein